MTDVRSPVVYFTDYFIFIIRFFFFLLFFLRFPSMRLCVSLFVVFLRDMFISMGVSDSLTSSFFFTFSLSGDCADFPFFMVLVWSKCVVVCVCAYVCVGVCARALLEVCAPSLTHSYIHTHKRTRIHVPSPSAFAVSILIFVFLRPAL